MTISPALEDILEIGKRPAPSLPADQPLRTSKIAKTGLVLGLLAGVAGFASLLCSPPRPGYIVPDTSAALTVAVLLAALFSVLGLVVAFIASIRIAISMKPIGGYRLCLATVALAVVANAIWLVYFRISL